MDPEAIGLPTAGVYSVNYIIIVAVSCIYTCKLKLYRSPVRAVIVHKIHIQCTLIYSCLAGSEVYYYV